MRSWGECGTNYRAQWRLWNYSTLQTSNLHSRVKSCFVQVFLVTTYAQATVVFHLDKLRIRRNEKALSLLFSYSSLFQGSGSRQHFFSPHQFCKYQEPAFDFLLLISTTDFEKATSYFSTSTPAFSQAYVLCVRTSFSPVETSFIALSFRSFRNNFLFRWCLRRRL